MLVGMYEIALHNVQIREQIDTLSMYGGQRKAMETILMSHPLFDFKGHILQDHTQGRVYVLADGEAYLKESHADPIFQLKGGKGPLIRVDGSRSKAFPDILAVCMEGTGRPLGFTWTTDLVGGWQKELGSYICGLMERNEAPDPQSFLQWKEDRAFIDVEYAESCTGEHPYLLEDEYTKKILDGIFQRQTCQDIMYAGDIVVGG